MAASIWHSAVDTANTNIHHTSLPTGSCYFRHLSSGAEAPTCGCRKFWLDRPAGSQDGSSPEEKAICCCGHHACFHDTQPAVVVPPPVHTSHHTTTSAIAANSEPFASIDKNRNIGPSTFPQVRQTIHVPHPIRDYNFAHPEGGRGRTDTWGGLNRFTRWQQDPSWLPSTAPPSIISCDQTGPSANDPERPNSRLALLARPYVPFVSKLEGIAASPTVEDTSSIRESVHSSHGIEPAPELRPVEETIHTTDEKKPQSIGPGDVSRMSVDAARSSPKSPGVVLDTPQDRPVTPTEGTALTQDWQNLIQTCMRRLGDLENISFSHVPVEEVQDKFEMLDGRLLDLEYWKADLETRLKDSEMLIDDKGSSASSSLSSQTNKETFLARVADIETRLEDLESAHPSYACPWEIEVVLLPFSRKLSGVWHEQTDDQELKASLPNADEWNGAGVSAGGLLENRKNGRMGWTTDSIQAWADTVHPWLWPKAPGPNNRIFKRLRSRGLVRTVTLTDTGAHSIWASLKETFSDFLNEQPSHTLNPRQQSYEALNQPLVPLRKIRKSSWLRFLSPHELITPATWDLAFLNSGVFMHAKGGVKRLYLTTADAYTQPYSKAWTWQRIRELPLFSRGSSRSSVIASKENYYEPCWDHVPLLDDSFCFDSFASLRSDSSEERRGRSASRRDLEASRSPSTSSAETIIARHAFSFPVIGRKTSRSKRRSSPSCTPIAYQKRRRMSSSPGFRGGPVELTPRWSHEPPTPSLTDNLWDTRSQGLARSSSRKRGSTPFAYATPHSHNFANLYLAMADGGDTEAESTGAPESEKEWEGVEENENENEDETVIRNSFGSHRRASSRMSSGSDSGVEFGAEDDDPDGDGWTIYEA